jgi:HAD superfamily hydrolase (TIGR01549 family)
MSVSVTMEEQATLDLQVRFFVGCLRSGCSHLMRVFAESPVCAVTSRLIFVGKASPADVFTPDYSVLENPSDHHVFINAKNSGKRFLICKEELHVGDSSHNVFPTASANTMVRPIFVVRDPIRIFDSWKNVGWTEVQNLINCYDNMYRMLHIAPSPAVSCIVYERLIAEPKPEVKRLCTHWGVPFSESMLDFKQPFGSDHNLLSNAEKDTLEEHLGRQYLRCWQDDVARLRAILTGKSWFGFDLDDTLHEFRRASGAATHSVLEEISQQSGTSLERLKEEYQKILTDKTANAFSDGKTSFDYRKDRFTAVLAHFSVAPDERFLSRLLHLYETTLTTSHELKSGAVGLLSTLKRLGKRIVVITEGPQDAQERTVQALGLSEYIDFLATTNHFRVTKASGLFQKVLEHLGISSRDIAYIGDNEERDMKPALAEGIFSIHLAETEHVSLTSFPPRINTLRKLQYILSDESNE